MKISDLKDDQIVYAFLHGDLFLGERAYLMEEDAILIKNKIIDLCPGLIIAIYETVTSDLPRDFDIYERTEE